MYLRVRPSARRPLGSGGGTVVTPPPALTLCCSALPGLRFVILFKLREKVIAARVAGSPRGYEHDILIKSAGTADYITQESKINHSRGSGIIQA